MDLTTFHQQVMCWNWRHSLTPAVNPHEANTRITVSISGKTFSPSQERQRNRPFTWDYLELAEEMKVSPFGLLLSLTHKSRFQLQYTPHETKEVEIRFDQI